MSIKTAPTSLDELTNSLLETEEVQPLSTADRVHLTPANSYYRSQLFTTFHSINSLIAAASPLLSMITKLSKHTSALQYTTLHKNLVHEIKAFECQTQNHGYRANTILAARYILCAWADEIILHTLDHAAVAWEKQSLLRTFQRESYGSDRFFLILERSCEDPVLYLDLLELIYLCLRFGFQGKFRNQAQGQEELTALTDTLYHAIREQRGEISKALSDCQLDNLPKNYLRRKLRLMTVIPSLSVIGLLLIFALTFSNKPITKSDPVSEFNSQTQP